MAKKLSNARRYYLRMRALVGETIVDTYAADLDHPEIENSDAMAEIICDLMHLCDRSEVSFRDVLEAARTFYDSDTDPANDVTEAAAIEGYGEMESEEHGG